MKDVALELENVIDSAGSMGLRSDVAVLVMNLKSLSGYELSPSCEFFVLWPSQVECHRCCNPNDGLVTYVRRHVVV